MQFRKMSRIKSYIYVIKDIKPKENETALVPINTIAFTGTVKIHGTNGCIIFDRKSNKIYAASKKNIITIEKDNAGFASFVDKNKEFLLKTFHSTFFTGSKIYIYGEWAGKGIQKGMAINKIEKTFFIFGIKIDDSEYLINQESLLSNFIDPDNNIQSIFEFKTFERKLDIYNPEPGIENMMKDTLAVEELCPVAHSLGSDGLGEGIVWTTFVENEIFMFKTKGDKHQTRSIVAPKIADPFAEIKRLVATEVSKLWRLEQMYNETFDILNGGEPDVKRLGQYIKAVNQDIIKEDMNLLHENNLIIKDISKLVNINAKNYFFQEFNNFILKKENENETI